ncbi:FkbM family methyltransferase [Kiloniella sp.]|uniref:FkbM family methyltransferase n=1 Tax=Kiloniella sp. TaxID=1938587 RepID=UPI003A94E06E
MDDGLIFKGTMQNVILQVEKVVKTFPRRVSGTVICDGVQLEYVDLHSFYYQAKQIFNEKLYDFDIEKQAPRIIDCGAHIGLATLYFYRKFPDAVITSFEADPNIFKVLKKNINAMGLSDKGTKNQAVWISDNGVSFNSTSDDSGYVSDDGIKVPSIRLHDLLADEVEVDLLKLDIEGAEFAVIDDCVDMLHKVKHVIVEGHILKDQSNFPSKLGQMLAKFETIGMKYVLSDLHSATWIKGKQKPPFHSIKSDRYICSVFAWWEE